MDCFGLHAGKDEEALEQPLSLVEPLAELAREHGHLGRRAAGLSGRDVERGAHHCDRRAQLVGGVLDETALRLERGLESCEQPVDRVAEVLQFVAAADRRRETLVEILLGDVLGRVRRSYGAAGASGRTSTSRGQARAGNDPEPDERPEEEVVDSSRGGDLRC